MKTSSTASMLLSLPLLATSAAAAFLNFPSSGPSEPRWLTKDAAPVASSERRATNSSAWPHGPLDTKGRDIINSRGDVVNWAGINWPMSGETMIPEGLEWASVDEILDHVAEVGWNWLRMGYAIEMVDEIYLRDGADVPLEVAMIQALGYVNGTKVTNEVIAKNPSWTRQTGRFEIWSDIAKAAEKRGIFIHPDVHVGKAQWCCSHTDGNSWFDDLNFPVANWLRGLKYVATWALDHPNVASMSLRNELRESWNVTNLYYNWHTLVGNMTAGSDAIHEANPDMLITWSGMQYDQDLSALTTGKNLFTAPCYKCTAIRDAATREPEYFNLADHPWGSKIVWELHLYTGSEDINTDNCEVVEAELYRSGFHALGMDAPSGCDIIGDCPKPKQLTPVMLSEFGHAQDETIYNATLQNCLKDYTQRHNISWAVWSLAGSYRIRSGVQGMADTWGLSSFDWQGWNYAAGIDGYWKPWIQATNPTKLD